MGAIRQKGKFTSERGRNTVGFKFPHVDIFNTRRGLSSINKKLKAVKGDVKIFYSSRNKAVKTHTHTHTVLNTEELRDDVSHEPFLMKLTEDKLPLTKR